MMELQDLNGCGDKVTEEETESQRQLKAQMKSFTEEMASKVPSQSLP